MFRSRLARKIRAVFVLGFAFGILCIGAYFVEMIHPVHNFLSFYADVEGFVSGAVASARNGS